MHEQVLSAAGMPLVVRTDNGAKRLRVTFGIKTSADCVLHWGISRRPGSTWRCPPRESWPPGTVEATGGAVQTPFQRGANDERNVTIELDVPAAPEHLSFVLHLPKEKRWLKNGAGDFSIELPRGDAPAVEDKLKQWAPQAERRQVFRLDSGEQLAAGVASSREAIRIFLVSDAEAPLVLHWGLAERFAHEWKLPPESHRPAGTVVIDDKAVQSAFAAREGLQWLELTFPRPADGTIPRGLRFVLHQPAFGEWLKQNGTDILLPLAEQKADPRIGSPKMQELAEAIIEAEVGKGSWTLMHRFNLCYDLLGKAEDDADALALLFAWLRYSAIRQLDWQRNYNTKPRDLSHAQDRLTQRIAGVWRKQAAGSMGRTWARLMLTTLGRGGDGQQVRDEILHIMHRHDIKEVHGHFIEEWHQKLHNNTTPDDVVICEAYIAFMRSNGDGKQFYQALERGGVTRERLRSFERPIRSEPGFYADRKNALIPEFENFLRILKSLHSGTDLETAANAARGRLDDRTRKEVDRSLSLRKGNKAGLELARAIVTAREALAQLLGKVSDDSAARDLLFLDLALTEALRGAVEGQDLDKLQRDALADLIQAGLDNLKLSAADDELHHCGQHWSVLLSKQREGPDWALHALSVTDRMSRSVHAFVDSITTHLQPRAEYLGEAFGVEKWVVPLFSEEIVRGTPVFALSRVLRHLDPILRKAAGLGGWQVISPAGAFGRVRVVDSLLAVQAEQFTEPTVVVTPAVSGEEEIPAGVTAVLTTDRPDLVSHVAVRARNAGVLFASCFEPPIFDQLAALHGKTLALAVTPGGDVKYEEAAAPANTAQPTGKHPSGPVAAIAKPAFSRWAVPAEEFTSAIVGGKSNNLNGLRNRVPDWIHFPISIALPFGIFEKTLEDEPNRALREQYAALLREAELKPAEVLARVRSLVLELKAPAALQSSLLDVWQRAGLPSIPWERVWHGVTRVWASKWNERAYYSRRARGIPHDNLLMAVLIQQVVAADYACVIHTANPLTKDRNEIYAEVVLGLGETLVGNYPGRALSFVGRKRDQELKLVTYPSKSVGLYGTGVIFRSDSNGEDLEGFAGAGLYDSVLAEEAQRRTLDYSGERLVWDTKFRDDLLTSVVRIGLEVEKVIGTPQDIEAAVSNGKYYVVQTRPQVGLE